MMFRESRCKSELACVAATWPEFVGMFGIRAKTVTLTEKVEMPAEVETKVERWLSKSAAMRYQHSLKQVADR